MRGQLSYNYSDIVPTSGINDIGRGVIGDGRCSDEAASSFAQSSLSLAPGLLFPEGSLQRAPYTH